MIEKVTMYQAVCDRCGKAHIDEHNGYVAWSDDSSAMEAAHESDWQEINGKLYCPDCVQYNEVKDEYEPKEGKS